MHLPPNSLLLPPLGKMWVSFESPDPIGGQEEQQEKLKCIIRLYRNDVVHVTMTLRVVKGRKMSYEMAR